MITSFDFNFGIVEVHNDYILSVMKEGVTVFSKYNDLLKMGANQYYKNKPFVYITNRINSYSVDPAIHMEMSKIKNLIGVAVISSDPRQKMQTKLEKSLFKKEFKLFETLEQALEWKNEILKKHIRDSKDLN
ncbi:MULTISPECIES: STAS/SEC14 domain-containing protein [Aquimarina]|uniref:STAS/SEC14 domain-containing protein n=1 Tax=Aquimarina TaxID=290174 RepID=UPI000D696D02|nr:MULTISPECIES: STAS/SEC14 domain-containing protein [Aquimarina]